MTKIYSSTHKYATILIQSHTYGCFINVIVADINILCVTFRQMSDYRVLIENEIRTRVQFLLSVIIHTLNFVKNMQFTLNIIV